MRGYGYRILFAVTLLLLVALSVWWTVLIRQSIRAEHDASLRQLELRTRLEPGVDREARERAIEERFERRSLMVLGEGALLFVLLGICFLMLMRLVGQERRQVRAMRRFISTVTHEMKTPLAGVKSLLETARAGDLPPERRQELMGMGLAETERLEHMVENVLVAGRLRSDLQPVRMEIARLGELLDPFVEHRRRVLPAGASLALDHDGDTRALDVLVDPDFVRMILDNLVDNALKYGGRDPAIEIRVCRDETRVSIEVSDSGEGFEPGDAETLFIPFERMSGAAASHHGTGLGLSISRGLARRMGGDVTAASEGPGRGSCFTLWIPGRPS